MTDGAVPKGAEPAIERRLATILMADVAGYSRMMGENEERTVQTLQGHREIFDALLKAHRGRIFNTAGDAILAEFPSAVEAVRCATEIQTALRTRNDHLPAEQRMAFRIGINLGDVIVQGGDLLGDGVNVAARIQTIAEPGGVCISGSVYDQIQNKLTLQIRQLGEKSFKNIAQPVRTFSITDDGTAAPGVRWPARKAPLVAAAAIVAGLIAVGAGGVWLYRDYHLRMVEDARRAEESNRAAAAQARADRENAARATAAREARLLAELESAKSALTQAEASKRKAEQERLSAEAAQREAKLQTELKAAKDALQKAAESEKKAEQERTAAAEAMKTAEAAKKAQSDRVAAAATKAGAEIKPGAAIAAKTPEPSAAKGIDRLDGTHIGRMCTTNADNTLRCWGVVLTVQHGALSATWNTRFNNEPAHAKGEIAPDGSVKLALDGYSPKGRPLTADAKGSLVDNKLTVSGVWSNGAPISGT
ncbi:MAG TPA: adenylate/guanylate cyclase domain-containing protein, partial [Casimicrobiaceae bacterium]|nr:adenylate/guanylate cyclase domain-containing protein [Casimicrobiaceae bacterium]